jgi:hypothetical protein
MRPAPLEVTPQDRAQVPGAGSEVGEVRDGGDGFVHRRSIWIGERRLGHVPSKSTG